MQLKKLFTLGAAALLSAAPAKTTAQTWQTVLDYQFTAGKAAAGECIAADALGNVFSGGEGNDAAGITHGIVLQTADTTETSWSFSDDSNPSPTQYQSYMYGVGVDASANVYSVGALAPNASGVPQWYVRESLNSGGAWSTVDLYQYATGHLAYAQGFTADNSGNIYVVGWGDDAGTRKDPTGNIHWLIRKSANAGQSWTLVDDLEGFSATGAGFAPGAGIFVVGDEYASSSSAWLVRRSVSGGLGTWSTVDGPITGGAAHGVCSDSQGNIYVAGSQFIITQPATKHTAAQGYYAWVTRESNNGGTTWSTVDTFAYAPNETANGLGIAKNSTGDVVVVGYAYDAQNIRHWIVRTPDSSGTWQTIDDFQPGSGASALGVVTDAAGNLLVTGASSGADGDWIVRKLVP